MTYNNPLADLFSRIRNAYVSKQVKVLVNNSRFVIVVLDFLYKEGYIRGFACVDQKQILVFLKYIKNEPVFRELKQISTPGNRVYFNLRRLKNLVNNRK
jgi:small subunit ribosomal protein S8